MQQPSSLLTAEQIAKSFPAGGRRTNRARRSDSQHRSGRSRGLLGRSARARAPCCAFRPDSTQPRRVLVNGRHYSPNPQVAMVFQSFALLPGSPCRRMPSSASSRAAFRKRSARRKRLWRSAWLASKVLKALIRRSCRAVCASASVSPALLYETDVLMMDEPFSALDVLTAENLRGN